MTRYIGLLTLAAIGLLAGCGGSSKPVGKVSGKVTFQGMPVNEGMVTFVRVGGSGSGAGPIEGGAYSAKGVEGGIPTGDYVAVVMPPQVTKELGPNTSPAVVLKEMKEIPKKYRSETTSDLKLSVKEGSNEFNIDMKP